MMHSKLFATLPVLILSAITIFAQTGSCPELVQQAMQTVESRCEPTERNQICYGYTSMNADPQPDASDFVFENIGDITDVAAVQRLQLAGLDVNSGIWGVVLMRVQANIPNSLPGQNVTMLLFGDTELRNAAESVAQQVPPELTQTITANTAVNIRELPDTNASIIGAINSGASIIANGRLADNSWIRVHDATDRTGWVFANLLSGSGDFNSLNIVEAQEPAFGPMQAFYFSAGIGKADCGEVPQDGLLVQTPQGVGTINLLINEVEVDMGSTVYFQINDNRQMSVNPVHGAARVTAGGVSRTAVAGTRVRLQLDENYVVDGEPSEIESYYDDEEIYNLPVDALEYDVDIEEGLDDEELDLYLQYDDLFENLNVEDVDEAFDYLDEHGTDEDFDLVGYLVDELDYDSFDDDLQGYLEDDLGYDLNMYDYSDDGYTDDYADDSSDDDYTDDSSDDGYTDDYTDDPGDDSYADDSGG